MRLSYNIVLFFGRLWSFPDYDVKYDWFNLLYMFLGGEEHSFG